MSTVILIRSGSTDFDEQHRIQGTLDLPLNANGEKQVRQTIEELCGLSLGMIYTSPCEPARSTAIRLGTERGIPIRDVAGLENWNHGLWQGLPIEELRRKQPKVFRQWLEAPASICPPGGESLSDVWERVRRALIKPLKNKVNVAFVASEPLATVIGCLVRGTKMDEVDFGSGSGGKPAWEYLRTNGHVPATSLVPPVPKPIRQEVPSVAP